MKVWQKAKYFLCDGDDVCVLVEENVMQGIRKNL
jgi:hypothetical protein